MVPTISSMSVENSLLVTTRGSPLRPLGQAFDVLPFSIIPHALGRNPPPPITTIGALERVCLCCWNADHNNSMFRRSSISLMHSEIWYVYTHCTLDWN